MPLIIRRWNYPDVDEKSKRRECNRNLEKNRESDIIKVSGVIVNNGRSKEEVKRTIKELIKMLTME